MGGLKKGRVVLGWREWAALPGLGIPRIKAKLDTGARTSALHAFTVAPLRRRGRSLVRFGVHPLQGRDEPVVWCEAEVADRRVVADSSGHRERRYVIVSDLMLAGERYPVEITLTDRDSMRFRMLIGRTALYRRFVVDPALSYRAPAVSPLASR